MNHADVQSSGNVCILGFDVANKLFREGGERAVNAVVRINSIPYRVLGVLESRGSSFGFSRDNVVITTYENVDRNFPSGFSFVIAVMTDHVAKVNVAMGEAEGTFRAIRKLTTTEANNFHRRQTTIHSDSFFFPDMKLHSICCQRWKCFLPMEMYIALQMFPLHL